MEMLALLQDYDGSIEWAFEENITTLGWFYTFKGHSWFKSLENGFGGEF